jgi:hypothetical protein
MYRSVVSQQGRVTVEADANEAEDIRSAELRAELIEIIGPTGTPDDGFKISLPGRGAFDFAIGQNALSRRSRVQQAHRRRISTRGRSSGRMPGKDPTTS